MFCIRQDFLQFAFGAHDETVRVGIEIERLVCFKAIDLGYYTIIILILVGGLWGDCVRGFPRGELLELHDIAS